MTNRVILIKRISGGKIAEEWGIGTIGSNLRGQLLEQEKQIGDEQLPNPIEA
jgi:hypothetical protein